MADNSRFVKLEQAIDIVIELARENTIDKSSSYVENDMGDTAAKQNAAIDTIEDFFTNVVFEGRL
jgi:hypothetical protein